MSARSPLSPCYLEVAEMLSEEEVVASPGRGRDDGARAGIPWKGTGRRGNLGDWLFRNLTRLFAVGILALVGLMVYEMAVAARPSMLEFGWRFLWSTEWDPVAETFGALPFIYGTLVTSLLALLFAGITGLGVAIYLSELAPSWLRSPISFLVELLAAIPSVVYGIWGIFVLVPWVRSTVQPLLGKTLGFLPLFQGPPYGIGMLSGGLILAIMILPTITAVAREVMRAVPEAQREAALALGATRWEVTRMAVLPYARSGIIGGAMLGLGRALGETMAVTMVIGNRPQISASLFAPADTMASVIANNFAEATSDLHISALIEIGLILFGVSLALNVLARFLIWSTTRSLEGGTK